MRKLQHYLFCVQYMHTHPKCLREYLILLLHCQGTRGLKPLVCAHVIIWFPPTTTSIESKGLAAPTAVYCIQDAHISVLPGHVAVTTATKWGTQKQQSHDCFISFDLIMVYHTHGISWPLNSHHIAIMPFPKHSSRCAEKSYTSIAEMPCKGRSIKSNVNQILLSWMFFNEAICANKLS